MKSRTKKNRPGDKHSRLELRLYVANSSPRSQLARTNLRTFCDRYLERGYRVQIIDIVRDPEAAFRDDILATPTLMRVSPAPQKTVIGSLSDAASLLRAFDLVQEGSISDSVTFVQSAGEA
jgi:circadian clock protein KaiB